MCETFSNNVTVIHLSLGIEASILDSIDVQGLEYLLKLNIQKGKAFSSLGQGKDGFKAYQSALDVSILFLHSSESFLINSNILAISLRRYFITPRVRQIVTLIEVFPFLSSAGSL